MTPASDPKVPGAGNFEPIGPRVAKKEQNGSWNISLKLLAHEKSPVFN